MVSMLWSDTSSGKFKVRLVNLPRQQAGLACVRMLTMINSGEDSDVNPAAMAAYKIRGARAEGGTEVRREELPTFRQRESRQ